jgi:hypothetical protein
MVLVLPRQRFGLGALLAGISGHQLLLDWARRCESTCVKVGSRNYHVRAREKLIKFYLNYI